ncbi:MAG: VacJ family lipoprotein [Pseudomonadota bacterium]
MIWRNAARKRLTTMIVAGAAAGLVGAAHAADEPSDPFEPANRVFFGFNNVVDRVVLKPAARAYRFITPSPVRTGVRNFLGNLGTPVTLTNDVLQGEWARAGTTVSRFGINTTIGFFGFLDPAERMGYEPHSEDFNQTLATYGVPAGPYLYLPFLGPTTARGVVGRGVDTVSDPLTWLNHPPGDTVRGVQTGTGVLTGREALLDPLDQLERESIDFYASVRSLYYQTLESQIANGANDFDNLPDIEFGDDFDDEDF